MKNGAGNNIRLGLFVTISIALFIIAIYFIGKKQQLFSDTFHVWGVFKDVNGLQVGNNVRFAGINIGTVDNIEITNDTSVKVEIVIDNDVQKFIKKDAVAVIGSDGLMGNKILSIAPGGSKEQIKNEDFIKTMQPVSMDEIFGKLKATVDNAASITDDLSAIMGNIRRGRGTIGKLFMDTIFAGNLDRTLNNVQQGTKGFKQNMDAAQNSFLLRGFFKKKDKEKQKEQDKINGKTPDEKPKKWWKRSKAE
ncbi:MAG: MCE family protein [Bacteroidia bacterium]|nr:MCE family protein [Bacteroidia bacterium]